MSRQGIGRHFYFNQVPGLDAEIDNLYSKIQRRQLRSTDMDLAEVAAAVAPRIRSGQLTVLENVADGSTALKGLRVGDQTVSSDAQTIVRIKRSTVTISTGPTLISIGAETAHHVVVVPTWDGFVNNEDDFVACSVTPSAGNEQFIFHPNIWKEFSTPTSALSPTLGGAGDLSGTYDYRWTHYGSASQLESAVSDASASVSPSSQKVVLSGLSGSSDPTADEFRIYRRKTSAGEVDWRLLAQVDNEETSFTDNIADSVVATGALAPSGWDVHLSIYNTSGDPKDVTQNTKVTLIALVY